MTEQGILFECALAATRIVVAWGVQHGPTVRGQSARIVGELKRLFCQRAAADARTCQLHLMCLGTTVKGYPRHPSRLGYATELVPYVHRG